MCGRFYRGGRTGRRAVLHGPTYTARAHAARAHASRAHADGGGRGRRPSPPSSTVPLVTPPAPAPLAAPLATPPAPAPLAAPPPHRPCRPAPSHHPTGPGFPHRLTIRAVLDTARRRGILGPMLMHPTFRFTYGDRPAGCHGRAA
ncbi:hypothetical protein GCM10010389_30960 [Streptomyces echinoruber]|uniref:Uncharacterized protein n=1 Tax=Streptomyces echinoruber TaxID=68898 RepID=A0A918VEA6_9ACTN|nr:hypothetical protein GCM10010389_30960 [Streptomyces echinoruber]